jgi:hypothetical protein
LKGKKDYYFFISKGEEEGEMIVADGERTEKIWAASRAVGAGSTKVRGVNQGRHRWPWWKSKGFAWV